VYEELKRKHGHCGRLDVLIIGGIRRGDGYGGGDGSGSGDGE